MAIESLISIYKNFVTEELKLAKLISEMEKEEKYDNTVGLRGYAKAIQNNDYIKITVDKIPEKVALFKEVGTQYYAAAKEFWLGSIMYALNEIKVKPINGKCVAHIKVFYKDKTWDTDNHHVSFIINAIRYSGVIKDDSFSDLSYMVSGSRAPGNDYFTEIYVCSEEMYPALYNKIR